MSASLSLTDIFIDQSVVLTTSLPVSNVGIRVDDGQGVFENAEEQMDTEFNPRTARAPGTHDIKFHAKGRYEVTATDTQRDTVFIVTTKYR